MNRLILKFLSINIFILFLSDISYASVSSVSSPTIKKGSLKLISRYSYSLDNESNSKKDKLFTRFGIGYGVTKSFAVELSANQENPSNDSYEHENMSFRFNFQTFEQSVHGFDAGFRVTYDMMDGDKDADEVELRLMGKYQSGNYEFRSNLVIETEVGHNSEEGIQLEPRFQVVRKFDIGLEKPIKAGFEMFNDFKNLRFIDDEFNQDQEFGPVVKGNFTDTVSYQFGALFGLNGDSADTALRFFLYKKF